MKYLISLSLLVLISTACSKSDSEPEKEIPVPVIPSVTTAQITSITESSAISGGEITNDGGAPITARGVCWSTVQNPTISDEKTSDGTGSGDFSSSLSGLMENTTYYLRAYATNSKGTAYGPEISFSTIESEPIAKVFEGDVILTTQQEVEIFGAAGYKEITGSLIIQSENQTEISNLEVFKRP